MAQAGITQVAIQWVSRSKEMPYLETPVIPEEQTQLSDSAGTLAADPFLAVGEWVRQQELMEAIRVRYTCRTVTQMPA